MYINYRIQAVGAAASEENPFDFINQIQRPRFIKSHLPICFLPKQLWQVKPKIVYVAREPKDAAISFYHHYYNFYKYSGTKDAFLDLYLKGSGKCDSNRKTKRRIISLLHIHFSRTWQLLGSR